MNFCSILWSTDDWGLQKKPPTASKTRTIKSRGSPPIEILYYATDGCGISHNSIIILVPRVGVEVSMKELLENIAKALVDYPDEVFVNEIQNEKSIILELKVSKDDMGKVIGKQGRIAKAIRTVVKAAAVKDNRRVVVDIVQ